MADADDDAGDEAGGKRSALRPTPCHCRILVVLFVALAFVLIGVYSDWYDGAITDTTLRDKERVAFCAQKCRPKNCDKLECLWTRCLHEDVKAPLVTFEADGPTLCKDGKWIEPTNQYVDFQGVRDASPFDLPSARRR